MVLRSGKRLNHDIPGVAVSGEIDSYVKLLLLVDIPFDLGNNLENALVLKLRYLFTPAEQN
jgi:hypothetical protein